MPSSTPASGTATPSHLSGTATPTRQSDRTTTPPDDVPDEPLLCHICANPPTYLSLSPCLHTTCHTCALRLRALYKSSSCTVCKQPQPRLLFLLPTSLPDPGSLQGGDQAEKDRVWQDFQERCSFSDEALAIAFESLPVKQATLQLLRFNCPFSSLHSLTSPDTPPPRGSPPQPCTYVALRGGFPELARHVRERHGRMLCELCVRTKKIFAHEHVLYTPGQLVEHCPSLKRAGWEVPRAERGGRGRGRGRGRGGRAPNGAPHPDGSDAQATDGDPAPPAAAEDDEDDSVEWSHPLCAFCRECFAGSDELYAHLREAHEECFLCRRAGERDVYFQNYPSLESHFSRAHYPCPHASCLAQHFVVFSTPLDLKAHYVEAHKEELSQRELREMRGLGGLFAEAGAVPGAPTPSSSSAGGSAGRGGAGGRRGRFGAQLTTTAAAAANDLGSSGQENDQSRDALDSLQRQPLTDAQAAAWQALLKPLPVLPPTQSLALRSSLLAWMAHQQSARDLLTILHSILNNPASPTLSRAGEPSELTMRALQHLANQGQLGADEEQDLCTAVNSFRAERTAAFPSLRAGGDAADIVSGRGIAAPTPVAGGRAGPASAGRSARGGAGAGGAGAGAGGRTVWERVERAAARTAPAAAPTPPPARVQTAAQAFPALSAASAPAAARRGGAPATAWSASASSSSSAPAPRPAGQPFSVPARPSSGPRKAPGSGSSTPRSRPPQPVDSRAFPGLPTREVAKVPLGAVGGNSSLRNILGQQAAVPAGSSWGRSGPTSPTEVEELQEVEHTEPVVPGPAAGGGKKKRRGKETLFTLGSFPTA